MPVASINPTGKLWRPSGGRIRVVPPVEVDKYGYNCLDPARVLMPNVRNKITLPFSRWLGLRKILS